MLLLACGDDGGSSPPPTDSPTDTPSERTITVDIGDKPDSLFAFQDGDGPFQLAPARNGTTITLTIESDRYAVVRLCNPTSSVALVAYRAATETDIAFRCILRSAPVGNITGTITSTVDDGLQLLHGETINFEFAAETSFTYDLATSGTSDFVASRARLG